jgi:DNA-directed RNA polymerase specialized sigma24 family protein
VENLKKAVQSLSPTERQAILLRYQEQLPIKDISRILGRSNNAVKLLLSRARKKLAAHPYIKTRDRLARNQPKNPKKSRLLKVKTA